MGRSHARKVVVVGMEEIGSLGHLIRLGDVKESYYVEQLTIICMRGSKDATTS